MLNTQSIKQFAGGMLNSDLLKKNSTHKPLSSPNMKDSDTRSGARKNKNSRRGNKQAKEDENEDKDLILKSKSKSKSNLESSGDIKDLSEGKQREEKMISGKTASIKQYSDQLDAQEILKQCIEDQSDSAIGCDSGKSEAIKSPSKSMTHLDENREEGEFKAQLVWTNIILFVILHSCVPISLYFIITQQPLLTLIYSLVLIYASGIGITAGAHRLWSHKSYKAGLTVEIILMIFQTMAGQNSIYTWSRDHRVHHKFSETNADPHNIKRGFFFAHMGWLCCKKHPDVKEKGKLIDMSDLEANKLVMFQHNHFWWLAILFTVLVPVVIPVLLWNEHFWTAFVISFMLRYLTLLHGTWLVNSAAHYYGSRPYDVNIEARESPSAIYTGFGEGFHNYHHTFPYDYSTSEFGRYFNITTAFIDLCAYLGLVKDRRKVDSNTILKRRLRTGNLGEKEMNELEQQQEKHSNLTSSTTLTNRFQQKFQKTIDEVDELACDNIAAPLVNGGIRQTNGRPLAPLSNIIHELPYISGLTSMKFTM